MFKYRQRFSSCSPSHRERETVHMVTHPNEGVEADDEIDEGVNEEHVSIDKCISLTEKFVKGLE
jgi:hypothetical protein